MTSTSLAFGRAHNLLTRLIESPNLVSEVRGLEPRTFSALLRRIGLEDAGELVALATSEQLVTAFDEDLFKNDHPGERETFDGARFVTWLQVLLEAGDEAAVERMVELGEDFLAHALSSQVLVLDNDALQARMSTGGDDADVVDKLLESCFSEEFDGYLFVSTGPDGWDAVWSLIVTLDRDHHDFLVRVLDLCVAVGSPELEDLGDLVSALSEAESLAEDVEAAREDRRSKQGYVDPRQARAFLALSRRPPGAKGVLPRRDPISRAYFRDLEPAGDSMTHLVANDGRASWLDALDELAPTPRALGPSTYPEQTEEELPLQSAMRLLGERSAATFADRMGEFAYLANVIVAGADDGGARFSAAEAAEAVLATVDLGARLVATARLTLDRRPTPAELCEVLVACPADVLFREASGTLVARLGTRLGFVRSREEVSRALSELGQPDLKVAVS